MGLRRIMIMNEENLILNLPFPNLIGWRFQTLSVDRETETSISLIEKASQLTWNKKNHRGKK